MTRECGGIVVLGQIILATVFVSLLSLVGVVFLGMKEGTLQRIIDQLVSFAVGGLLGGAFFNLLPESMETGVSSLFTLVLAGILAFFLIETVFHWRHSHGKKYTVAAFTYLNLVGDGIHIVRSR